MNTKKLRNIDLKYVWHPYTDIDDFENSKFPIIDRAKGCYFYDSDGKAYIDGIASWWCINLGHSNAKLVDTINKQTSKLQHVILGGMSHEKIILLSQKLVNITPEGLNHCFFASDGSSAVEAALRIALQYWKNIGVNDKNLFVSLQDGYHGDTLGAVSVGYIQKFHQDLLGVINTNYRAMSPHCAKCPFKKHPKSCNIECFASMEKLIKQHHKQIAAVIIEPLCQGAAGIRIYPVEYLKKLRKLCDTYNLLLIADEIAVGFGRCATMFASQKAGISPDIMTLGKALTGGYLPMSATIINDNIYNSFRKNKTLYYGHTFSGNPIASAVALQVIKIYEEQKIIEKIKPLTKIMSEQIAESCKLLPNSFYNSLGMISAIEISSIDGGTTRAKKIANRALELGLFIRPMGNTVYLWPPLIITPQQITDMFNLLKIAIDETS